jgi:hypothetical protein
MMNVRISSALAVMHFTLVSCRVVSWRVVSCRVVSHTYAPFRVVCCHLFAGYTVNLAQVITLLTYVSEVYILNLNNHARYIPGCLSLPKKY